MIKCCENCKYLVKFKFGTVDGCELSDFPSNDNGTGCHYYEGNPEPKKQTNFERITASAESLASMFTESCDMCVYKDEPEPICRGKCQDGIKQWLEQEVEE